MTDIKRAEILAPAGNIDMLIAAVRSGADAVYLGAKEFSARKNAENFNLSELREAVKYCRIRGVKVYLALNTVIKDRELSSAFALARDAFNIGIDGIIIQDLGLARILHQKIPQLKLHASTQMSVHSPAALPLLKQLGFCRVVVAREMSKQQLKELCKKADKLGIEVEVFVHGALCMSLSGQCLLSAFLGSRSGNRGLCAGPCRLPFKAYGGTGYDLSLKDLSLLDYINELSQMGVVSFKIEGRMKRPEYVAAATAACRQALDRGFVSPELSDTLKNVFSRSGFTDGYYQNLPGKEMFGIRTKEDVLAADKAFPALHELYRAERRSVALNITARILQNEPISLCFSDGENSATVRGGIPSKAQTRPTEKQSVLNSLNKLGSTPYFAQNIEIALADGLFVSASELNSLRRAAVEALDKLRGEKFPEPSNAEYTPSFVRKESRFDPKILVRIDTPEQLPSSLEGIDGLIFPLEQDPAALKNLDIPLIVDIPRGIIDENAILKRLALFKECGFTSAFCGNLACIELAKKAGLAPLGDTGLNIANSEALTLTQELGMKAAVISCEEQLSSMSKLASILNKGIIAYGHIPLMLCKNCPLKNGSSCKDCDKKGFLTDRMGVQFPVRCRMGYSELLNSLPIWLADRQEELQFLDFLILYFTSETPERVNEVISAYKNNLPPDTKHTRGLYYRGTI